MHGSALPDVGAAPVVLFPKEPASPPPRPRPRQPSLFPERSPRVIPFESIPTVPKELKQRKRAPDHGKPLPSPAETARRAPKRQVEAVQPSFEFLPPIPPPARTLRNSVEAAIYCDAAVASRWQRASAALLDTAVVLAASVLCLAVYFYWTGELLFHRPALIAYGLVFGGILLFYRLFACLSSDRTPGMAWIGLRLLDFDGGQPGRRQRLYRLASGCLSVLPAGAGLLWALLDEEGLTWHDHISKTFATTEEPHQPGFRA